jgi:hypothetical protein
MVNTSLPYDVFTCCADYSDRLNNYCTGHGPPVGPPPQGYDEFLRESDSSRKRPNIINPDQSLGSYVSMPADTLVMILQFIGQSGPTPKFTPTPSPRQISFPPPHQPMPHPKQPHNNRHPINPAPTQPKGNPTNKGKTSAKGKAKKPTKTEDPRRRNNNPIGNNRKYENPGPATAPTQATVQIPGPSNFLMEPVMEPITTVEPIDMSYLNDFTGASASYQDDETMIACTPLETGEIVV